MRNTLDFPVPEQGQQKQHLRNVRVLYFLYYSCFGLMNVYLNVYLFKAGLSGKQIGLITGLAALLGMLGSPTWGAISDRYGLRRVLMALLVSGAGLFAGGLMFARGFLPMLACVVGNTFFSSSLLPLIETMNLSALRGRTELYGRQRAWGTVGYILSTMGIGFLLRGADLRLVFAAYALLMAVMLAFVWRLPADDMHISSAFSRKFLLLIRTPAWLVTTISLFVFGIGNAGMHSYLSMYLSQMGASETLIGNTWALGAISETAFMVFGGALIARIGARRVLPLAFLLYSARLLVYSVLTNPLLALPISLTHAITFVPFWLSAVALVNHITPQPLKATGQALLVATLSLSSVVGAPVAGAIIDAFGMPAVFRVFAGCTALAAFIYVTGSRWLDAKAPAAAD